MNATTADREVRTRRALKLFFYPLTLAFAVVSFLFGWEYFIGPVSDLAFDAAYTLVSVCLLVCLLAIVYLLVAHYGSA